MRMRGVMVMTVLSVAVAGFPSGAMADAHHYQLPAGSWTSIELTGSNGYSIHIGADGEGRMTLVTSKGGVSTEYWTSKAQTGGDRLRASLAGLGSIAIRFHQRGPTHHPPAYANCDGPRRTLRRGVVRGTIKFVGEREYTQVEVHEANAEVDEWTRQHCRYRKRHRGPSWTNRFQAWGGETTRVNFSAEKYGPGAIEGGRVVFRASSPSSRGSLFVYRRAEVVAPAATFRIPEPDTYPENVILTPPAPFIGTGTLARTPESVFAWEGNLAVQFPGVDPIPLTGPEITPHYCALRGCISQDI